MNQNNMNPVQLNPALVNSVMGYLQSQSLVPANGQMQPAQSGPTMQIMPQAQQPQTAMGHLWTGWPAQPGVQVGQQWMQQGQFVAPSSHTPQAGSQPASAQDIAAAVAAAMQPLLQEKNSVPVGAVVNDEQILVDRLRQAKAVGLTPRQALEQLHGVSSKSPSFGLKHADPCGFYRSITIQKLVR